MSDGLFPSGPWTGFYNYRPGDRHRMDLNLAFVNGVLTGEGRDDIGLFLIKGRYEASSGECHWMKTYVGAHDVYYRGFREGKGIWGTWEITIRDHGGFRIWPRGESEAETESVEESEPVEAVGAELAEMSDGNSYSPVGWSRNTQVSLKRLDKCSARAFTPKVSVA